MTAAPGQGLTWPLFSFHVGHTAFPWVLQHQAPAREAVTLWLGVHRERAWAISATENVTANQGNAKLIHFFLSAQSLPVPWVSLLGPVLF